MKKILLSVVSTASLMIATNASATCFNFVNGKGPSQVGIAFLAAPASKVCIDQTLDANGVEHTQISLSDSTGTLATLEGQVTAKGRCPGLCAEITLSSGEVDNEYANVEGVLLTVQSELDQRFGMLTGVLQMKAGRSLPQQYLIMGAE